MSEVLSFNQVEFSWIKGSSQILIKQFSFHDQKKYFIYGPSGSGKSTLLNLLTGFIRPDKGHVELLSRNITEMSDAQLNKYRAQHVGFIFQSFNLIPYLTAEENIKLPIKFTSKKPLFDVSKMASQLNLSHCLHTKTELLSQGEQQRVALIKALITGPNILVCDEPTSSLDKDVENQFFDVLFSDLCKAMTVIFVSHNLQLKDKFDQVISIEEFKNA